MNKELEEKFWLDALSIIYDDKSAIRRYSVCLASKNSLEMKLSFLNYLDGLFNSNELDEMLEENYENNAGERELPWYIERSKELESIADSICEQLINLSPTKKTRNIKPPYFKLKANIQDELQVKIIQTIHSLLSEKGFINVGIEQFSSFFQTNNLNTEKINWFGSQVTFVLFFDRLKEMRIITNHFLYRTMKFYFDVDGQDISKTNLSTVSDKLGHTKEPRNKSDIDEILLAVQKLVVN